jgi:hypothetical protein
MFLAARRTLGRCAALEALQPSMAIGEATFAAHLSIIHFSPSF